MEVNDITNQSNNHRLNLKYYHRILIMESNVENPALVASRGVRRNCISTRGTPRLILGRALSQESVLKIWKIGRASCRERV